MFSFSKAVLWSHRITFFPRALGYVVMFCVQWYLNYMSVAMLTIITISFYLVSQGYDVRWKFLLKNRTPNDQEEVLKFISDLFGEDYRACDTHHAPLHTPQSSIVTSFLGSKSVEARLWWTMHQLWMIQSVGVLSFIPTPTDLLHLEQLES